ncbi:MAG: PAS domain S-box protein [Dehalococcoidia bacterium]
MKATHKPLSSLADPRPVSPSKRAKQTMDEHALRLQALFDTMTEGVVLIAPDGRIIEANAAAERILGLTRSEITRRNCTASDWKILRPDGTPMPAQEMAGPRAMKERRPIRNVEMGIEHPAGFMAWMNVSASPLMNAEGELQGVVVTFADITESRQTDSKYHVILQTALDGFFVGDQDARFVEVNDAYCSMVGYAREELLTMSMRDIEAIDKPKDIARRINKLMERGYERFETRHRRKDGKIIDVEVSAHYINVEGGQFVVFVREVTERKRAEQVLKESEAKYRTLIESIPRRIFLKDTSSVYISCNKNYADYLNIKPDHISGSTDYDFYPADVAEKYRASDRIVIESGSKQTTEERYVQDGQERIAETLKTMVRDENGEIVGVLGICHDITERRRTEQALRGSEQRYRTLVESIPQKIFLKDKNSVYISCNGNLAKDLKIRPEEISGHTDYDFFPQDVAEEYRAHDKRVIESGNTQRLEERYMQDGEERLVETFKTPVRDECGKLIGILGIFHDITERKHTEDRLLEYKTAVEQSVDGIVVVDMRGYVRFANEAWARMHGYSVDELLGQHTSIFHTRARMESEVTPFCQYLRQTGSNAGEVWHVNKSGEEFLAWMTTTVLKGADQTPLGLLAIMRDITEQKETERWQRDQQIAKAREEELAKSRRRLLSAQESLRKEIASQLHGTVQSRLILLGHQLADLEASLTSQQTAEELAQVREKLEEVQNGLIRPISHRLFPSILRLGITSGLESLVDEYSATLPTNLRVGRQVRDIEQASRKAVSDDAKLALYRIAEETLSNIAKHTPSVSNVTVRLSLSDGRILRLMVSDDGDGFSTASSMPGIGLTIASDYAAAAGGNLSVKSIPGKGTRVTAQVPLGGSEENGR